MPRAPFSRARNITLFTLKSNIFRVGRHLLRAPGFVPNSPGGAGKARFNVATPTYEARTRPLHVQHTYYRIIFKQNPFNIISREVQGCTSTDFRLK